MADIGILHHKSELEHTCYIEIIPGPYQGTHWQDGCQFLDEVSFGFVEPIFERFLAGFDHYGINEGSREEWLRILDELEKLKTLLEESDGFENFMGEVGFFSEDVRNRFREDFPKFSRQLQNMIQEMVSWAREALKTSDCISVLGR